MTLSSEFKESARLVGWPEGVLNDPAKLSRIDSSLRENERFILADQILRNSLDLDDCVINRVPPLEFLDKYNNELSYKATCEGVNIVVGDELEKYCTYDHILNLMAIGKELTDYAAHAGISENIMKNFNTLQKKCDTECETYIAQLDSNPGLSVSYIDLNAMKSSYKTYTQRMGLTLLIYINAFRKNEKDPKMKTWLSDLEKALGETLERVGAGRTTIPKFSSLASPASSHRARMGPQSAVSCAAVEDIAGGARRPSYR